MLPLDSISAKRGGDLEVLWQEVLYVSDLQRVEREAQNNNLPWHTGPFVTPLSIEERIITKLPAESATVCFETHKWRW